MTAETPCGDRLSRGAGWFRLSRGARLVPFVPRSPVAGESLMAVMMIVMLVMTVVVMVLLMIAEGANQGSPGEKDGALRAAPRRTRSAGSSPTEDKERSRQPHGGQGALKAAPLHGALEAAPFGQDEERSKQPHLDRTRSARSSPVGTGRGALKAAPLHGALTAAPSGQRRWPAHAARQPAWARPHSSAAGQTHTRPAHT